MSEDLRYYFFDHDADGEPSIPADEGWKQMQHLLDASLPVSAVKSKRRYYYFIISTIAGITLLLSTLPLKNHFDRSRFVITHTTKTPSITQQATVANEIANQQPSAQPEAPLTSKEKSQSGRVHHLLQDPLSSFNTAQARFQDEIVTKKKDADKMKLLPEENTISIYNGTITATNADSTNAIRTKVVKEDTDNTATTKKKNAADKQPFNRWRIDAGIGTNISLQHTSKAMQPYPFVSLQYYFSPRFFAAASLSVLSSTGSDANGIKKTVYINDTFSNVSRYNEKLNYTKLSYADLALSAGMKLDEKISVQAGIQFSRLIKASTTTTLEPYDFNSNELLIQDFPRLTPTPSAAPVYTNSIKAQKLDMRYLAGVSYDLKKISFGLQYQGGIQPILKGDAVSNNKNNLLSLKIAYRFK